MDDMLENWRVYLWFIHRPIFVELMKLALFCLVLSALLSSETGDVLDWCTRIFWCCFDVAILAQMILGLTIRIANGYVYSWGTLWYTLMYSMSIGVPFGTLNKITNSSTALVVGFILFFLSIWVVAIIFSVLEIGNMSDEEKCYKLFFY